MDRFDNLEQKRQEFLKEFSDWSARVNSLNESIQAYRQKLDREQQEVTITLENLKREKQNLYIEAVEKLAADGVRIMSILIGESPKEYELELQQTFQRRLEQLKAFKEEI